WPLPPSAASRWPMRVFHPNVNRSTLASSKIPITPSLDYRIPRASQYPRTRERKEGHHAGARVPPTKRSELCKTSPTTPTRLKLTTRCACKGQRHQGLECLIAQALLSRKGQ